MEQRDLELIEKNKTNNKALEALYREHMDFEHRIEKFNNKMFLTPSEEIERKNLQKMKLAGRDKIEGILRDLRKQASVSE